MSSPASGPRRADVPTPTPRRLYIHDDLSEELRRHGEGAPAWLLWRALLTPPGGEPGRVGVLPPEAPSAPLLAGGLHPPCPAPVATHALRAHPGPPGAQRTRSGSRPR